MKTCSKCGGEFPATTEYWHRDSRAKDGLYSSCKTCQRETSRVSSRKTRATCEGREKAREATRKTRATIEGREKTRAATRNTHRKRYENGKWQEYMDNNPLVKLRQSMSSLLRESMKARGWSKNTKTHALLGCSFQEFSAHIESQFTAGMSWENAGQWHYDHILPCSSAENEEELRALQHYSNFQPLWGSANLSKSDALPLDWQERKAKLMEIYWSSQSVTN